MTEIIRKPEAYGCPCRSVREDKKHMITKISMRIISALVICMLITGLTGCAQNNTADEAETAQSLPLITNMAGNDTSAEVCNYLTDAGSANVAVFNEWVLDFAGTAGSDAGLTDKWTAPDAIDFDIAKCMDGWERHYDYSDSDCRMTAMLLLDGLISAEKTDSKYTGTYLMFDVDAIGNVPKYEVIRKNLNLFTTIFGDRTPQKGEDPSEVFGRVWDEYGIRVDNDDVSLLSIVCYDPDFDTAFVGHTGVLIRQAEDRYLFVEKLAFEQPYQAIMVNDTDELLKILAGREEYFGAEGDAGPFVYLNGQYLGEL